MDNRPNQYLSSAVANISSARNYSASLKQVIFIYKGFVQKKYDHKNILLKQVKRLYHTS